MILSVLKIIGIVLLVILVLLIFILGMILFIPIRYWFTVEYEGNPKADVLVKWSPILLKATVNFKDNKLEYIVKMLGGVVMTNTDAPLSWIGRKFFGDDEDIQTDSDTNYDKSKQKQSKRTMEVEKKENKKTGFVIIDDEIEFEKPESDTKKITKVSQKKQEKTKQSVVQKIRRKIQDIRRKIKQFFEKIKKINEKREALLNVYHHKRFEVAKKDAVVYIKTLWNIIKPKHLEGYVHFGLEDPAATGQVLGIIAMFLAWYHEFLQVEPDFEHACLDGNLKGNGKIRLFSVVKLIIKIMFNKNLIKVIKKVQTIIEA